MSQRNAAEQSSGCRVNFNFQRRDATAGCLPVWWDAERESVVVGCGESVEAVSSLERLGFLCEQAAVVAVLPYLDQALARAALGEVCPPGKISVVYGGTPCFLSLTDALRKGPTVLQRPFIPRYDHSLSRLQTAVLRDENDRILSLFKATLAGEFHEYWAIPHTLEAAKLWVRVGDLFAWKLPRFMIPTEFDRKIPERTLAEIKPNRPHSVLKFKKAVQAELICRWLSKRGPRRACRIQRAAREIAARIFCRRLLPQAWAGESAVENQLRIRAAKGKNSPLRDPRQWLWRALLRAPLPQVNFAYLEACLAWTLAQLLHPELFPPSNPLFDEPARRHLTETKLPSRAQEKQDPAASKGTA